MDKRWVKRSSVEWRHINSGWRVVKWADRDWEVHPLMPISAWKCCWKFKTQRQAMRFAELLAVPFSAGLDAVRNAIEDARREVEREGKE